MISALASGANYCLTVSIRGASPVYPQPRDRPGAFPCPTSSNPLPTVARSFIVGAGPAGLEAARVASARGHEVVVLEAANPRRRAAPFDGAHKATGRDDADRRTGALHNAKLAGVDLRYNLYAEAADVLGRKP